MLLLKYIEKQQDLADAAALRRLLSFDFDSLPVLSFHEKFRFMKEVVPLLSAALGISHEFVERNRTKWNAFSFIASHIQAGGWRQANGLVEERPISLSFSMRWQILFSIGGLDCYKFVDDLTEHNPRTAIFRAGRHFMPKRTHFMKQKITVGPHVILALIA